MHNCYKCGKGFNFPYLLLRHLNRVRLCSPDENDGKSLDNSGIFFQKVSTNEQKVTLDNQKVTLNEQKVTLTWSCKRCEKVLSSKNSLKRHEKNCSGVNSLQCPICLKVFTCKQNKHRHMKNVACENTTKQLDLEKENELLRKENAVLKASKVTTIHNNNNKTIHNNNIITNYAIKYEVKYNPETRCLTTNDPNAPIPELLCFNGFKHEAAKSKLKDIDQKVLQAHIDNVRIRKDYYSLYSFFFRNVDNRRLHMFNLAKNNNATHAQVFNNGNIERMEKSQLFENVSKYIGQYLLNMSIENTDVIHMLITDQTSKNAFLEVTKDRSHTFDYFKDSGEGPDLKNSLV